MVRGHEHESEGRYQSGNRVSLCSFHCCQARGAVCVCSSKVTAAWSLHLIAVPEGAEESGCKIRWQKRCTGCMFVQSLDHTQEGGTPERRMVHNH